MGRVRSCRGGDVCAADEWIGRVGRGCLVTVGVVFWIVAGVACNDTNPASLLSSSECPDGGLVIESGVDANGDGEIDEDEVEALYVFCLDGSEAHCAVAGEPHQMGSATWWDRQGNIARRARCE